MQINPAVIHAIIKGAMMECLLMNRPVSLLKDRK